MSWDNQRLCKQQQAGTCWTETRIRSENSLCGDGTHLLHKSVGRWNILVLS